MRVGIYLYLNSYSYPPLHTTQECYLYLYPPQIRDIIHDNVIAYPNRIKMRNKSRIKKSFSSQLHTNLLMILDRVFYKLKDR